GAELVLDGAGAVAGGAELAEGTDVRGLGHAGVAGFRGVLTHPPRRCSTPPQPVAVPPVEETGPAHSPCPPVSSTPASTTSPGSTTTPPAARCGRTRTPAPASASCSPGGCGSAWGGPTRRAGRSRSS